MAIRINHAANDLAETHEINVTPFIDVMLVLLVIFMVTAPLSTVTIPVKLPVASAKPAPQPNKPIFVSLQLNGAISVGEQNVAAEALGSTIGALTKGNRDTTIFLRADKGVSYEKLMALLNTLRDAGFLKIGLMGVQSTGGRPPRG